MGINLRKALWFTMVPFIFSASCKKDTTTPCRNAVYGFRVSGIWQPEKEIYNLGDTIFLYSEFPKLLTDYSIPTNPVIDYGNAVSIGGDIGIATPDSLTHMNIPAKDSFSFFSLEGNFLERDFNKNQGINFLYQEENTIYRFKGGIICNKKGFYGISVDNLLSQGIKGKNCTNAAFDMSIINSNKHESGYERALNISLDDNSLKKIYCFKVQ